jgi:glycosyltransferase involved in cell wall biosynthesis
MPKFTMPVSPTPQRQPQQQQQGGVQYSPTNIGIPFAPLGMPMGVPQATVVGQKRVGGGPPPMAMPGANLSRAVNYYADYGGCGFWRMIWPELLLNGYQKGIINGLTTMVLDKRFYQGLRSVRLQRQATPMQLQFMNFLKEGASQLNFKIIYEIDDIIFKDDIPDFNRCKVAFEDESVLQSAMSIMKLSDEISVTCEYMKNYYADKTGNTNITVIPNYAPKMWADGFYDKNEISKRYDQTKKRPRIGYCGSGTHIDVTNRTGQIDDFTHVVQQIIKTRKDFKWVMMGCYPLPLKPFVDSGEIEFAPWAPILQYPNAMHDLRLNATVAPLLDCSFNRAKSNIKFLESAYQGIPGAYQDIVTYKDAPIRFKTGDEMIDQLKHLLKDKSRYMETSKKTRKYADGMWLDDHLDEYQELYFTNYGDPSRKALLNLNPDQAHEK